eukprot:CAMPEP_0201527984 /NCGR_PEP_ID=MMETSP0161_2-20130828/36998_1 /ASSEMBLY_ACC=CAM_ASM_000251 /TAXON_ID=180227 /ORGANISM="Neoparamoeba aestuarina, Strain SoJaBio B1-5/56/2" /LENGTH=90 /DNA_ID=CAMNT_0047929061 /DNA_START=382 /DNA_END=654 /DNA_ORIENTATION=-
MTLHMALEYLSHRFGQNSRRGTKLHGSDWPDKYVPSTSRSMSFQEKVPALLKIHEKVRFGPVCMAISQTEWLSYYEGMEEMLAFARSIVS